MALVKRLESCKDKNRGKVVEDLQSFSVENIHWLLEFARGTICYDYDDYERLRTLSDLLKRLTFEFYGSPKHQVCNRAFTKFLELPQEIQDMIWIDAFPTSRIIEVPWLSQLQRLFGIDPQKQSQPTASQLQVPFVSKYSLKVSRENYYLFSFKLEWWNPRLNFFMRNIRIHFERDILYFKSFNRIKSFEIYNASSKRLDFSDKMFRIGIKRETFYYMLNRYIQISNNTIVIALDNTLVAILKRFKTLTELVVIKELGPKLGILESPDAPLCFLPEDAHEHEAWMEYEMTENAKWEADSDTDPDNGLQMESCADNPQAINELWDRVVEMDEGLKAFKNVKLTFRLATRGSTIPLSQMLECYYRGL